MAWVSFSTFSLSSLATASREAFTSVTFFSMHSMRSLGSFIFEQSVKLAISLSKGVSIDTTISSVASASAIHKLFPR